ncbi:MAG: peptidylprolyl isomerase [Acidimicrobiales bacterium]
MSRLRHGRTRRRAIVFFTGVGALLCLGVLGTGCDVSPPAATVNGATITQTQLNAELTDVVTTSHTGSYVRCFLELQQNLPSSLAGAGGNTVSTQLASSVLSTMILNELISQDLVNHRVVLTASDRTAARSDLEAELQSSAASGEAPSCDISGTQLIAGLPTGFANEAVHLQAEEEQLSVVLGHISLSTSVLDRYYKSHPTDFAEVCLSDIAVGTQTEAQSIRNSITSGSTTFGEAARQDSEDTSSASNSGAIPCMLLSGLQNSPVLSAISPLAPGQVSQPVSVSTNTGQTAWLLLQLNGRPELPFAQSRTLIRQILLGGEGTKLSSEIERITKSAHVAVDPRYGTWSHLRGVSAPAPPPAKYVLAPAADTPPSDSSLSGG